VHRARVARRRAECAAGGPRTIVARASQPPDARGRRGRAVEEFTNPEDPSIREDLAALWRQFVETRWVESSIRFNRLDGRRRQFAYRIVADDPEPGLHRLRVVEIAAE